VNSCVALKCFSNQSKTYFALLDTVVVTAVADLHFFLIKTLISINVGNSDCFYSHKLTLLVCL